MSFSLELSLFSLSHTLAHLEYSWSTLALEERRQKKDKETRGSKDQARKSRIKQLQKYCMRVSICMCDFLSRLEYIVLHVVLFCHGMGFSRCDHIFSISFPFSNSHGVMGFSCFG